jgi:hypothetical protein
MSQPFYQPARQNFSSSQSMQQPQGGFGGFGGGQMPQQNWGGGQGFGGFGGGQGFNFGGGQAFGGFQQQQFNPYQGGFGGGFGVGFSPFQGGFGGFNPMFGGIGGLGFNPMMGSGFGMPMQGFGGGFNPLQQQNQNDMQRTLDMRQMENVAGQGGAQQPATNSFADRMASIQQGKFQNPFQAQDAELNSQMQNLPEYQALQNAQKAFESSEGFKSIHQKRQDMARQMQERRQPMYGGIGGLGFNPMMGPQFGLPMQQLQAMLQGQQFGNQAHLARPDQPYLARPEVRQADEAYLRTWDAGRAALGGKQ